MSIWDQLGQLSVICCDECGTLASGIARRSGTWSVYSSDGLHYQHRCPSCVADCALPDRLYTFDDWDELTRIRLHRKTR